MKSLKQVWAAAQCFPGAERIYSRIGEEPEATITILIYFDRVFIDSNRLRAALGPEG